jgi:capsular exopolysaccharide synthesis family protein
VPGEGKSTIALSLARIAARSGLKTIIVDGDLRRPSVAKMIGYKTEMPGLIEFLTGEKSLEECLGKDKRSDAATLVCRKAPANPADVLSSHTMQQLVIGLKQSFDLVIIDAAPVLPVNDTKILSQLVDAVLFVVRWEKTPREAAVSALRSLADVHAPIAGIAFARADSERFRYYSYGYQNYQKYAKYYHE